MDDFYGIIRKVTF